MNNAEITMKVSERVKTKGQWRNKKREENKKIGEDGKVRSCERVVVGEE